MKKENRNEFTEMNDMLEEQFVKQVEGMGYTIDSPDDETININKDNEVVAVVNAREPYRMDTRFTPAELLPTIIAFSATKYEDRF